MARTLTLKEAAAALDVSEKTLRREVCERGAPHDVRAKPHAYLVDADELREWRQARVEEKRSAAAKAKARVEEARAGSRRDDDTGESDDDGPEAVLTPSRARTSAQHLRPVVAAVRSAGGCARTSPAPTHPSLSRPWPPR